MAVDKVVDEVLGKVVGKVVGKVMGKEADEESNVHTCSLVSKAPESSQFTIYCLQHRGAYQGLIH